MAKKFKFLSLFLVLVLFLTACGGGSDSDQGKGGDDAPDVVDPTSFPTKVQNDGEELDGGSITVALVSDTPFEGTFDWNFYTGAPDADILNWFSEPIFGFDDNYRITNDVESAAKFELSEDYKTITVKIEDGVKWHDGEPLKAEDYAYSFYVIGHPDYTGVRYADPLIMDIVGMEEYHNGETDTISGIEVVDEKTVKITWNEANPSLLTGIWAYATPKHYYEGIEVADLMTAEIYRTEPIGFGPYKVKRIVAGESVELVANEDYYGGAPKLDSVVIKVVNPSTVKQELENGGVDIAEFPTDQYDPKYQPENYQFLATMDNAYTYIGFKLGRWDKENRVAVQDKDTPLQDPALRQAFGYAMNNQAVAEKFYKGLRIPATTLMIPFFSDYHNPDIEGFTYNPDKAKQILEENGYKDVDGDGLVEDKDGNPMVFNFASMSGGDSAEPLAQAYIQNWKEVGLNVQLLDGRLHEFNSFYKRVGQEGDDDPAIDLYQAAWGTGTDPDPYGLYSKTSLYNYPRYVNEKNEELMSKGHSEDAFDIEYRKEIYDQWQELMIEDPPVIPTLYRYVLSGVNNRVKNYQLIEVGTDWGREDIAVTE